MTDSVDSTAICCTYPEYKALRSAGKVSLGVSPYDAVRLIDYLPRQYQIAHHFWSWVCFLSIPGFILVSIFYKWWLGIILLVVVTPIIWRAIKKSAVQFVFEYADENEEFYNRLLDNNLLTFRYH